MKINKLWFLENVYKNKSRIDIFHYILLSTLIVLIAPLMFLSLKYISNGTHGLELIIVFLLFILNVFIIPTIVEIENKIIKKISIEDFENKDNFSTSIYDRFINMKKFDYCLENKEKITLLYGNKNWILELYSKLSAEERLYFLSCNDFLNYIKDIDYLTKLNYFSKTINKINDKNSEEYYSVIIELFEADISNEEFIIENNLLLNSIKYKEKIKKEKEFILKNIEIIKM